MSNITKISLENHYSYKRSKDFINFKKLDKKLSRETTKAISDFNMIEDGDLVMVCLSGGKDSYSMLNILQKIQKRAFFDFKIIAVNLDQGQPNFPKDIISSYLKEKKVDFYIEEKNTYKIVNQVLKENETRCSLCSRLRRGILYSIASKLGANKIALGHHRDDIITTFFLNIFYNGQLKTMPPKLISDDKKHIVIRPLSYIAESDLKIYSQICKFPIIPCNFCGKQEGLKRKEVNKLIKEWENKNPGMLWSILHALSHISPSHLLDRNMFDFKNLKNV